MAKKEIVTLIDDITNEPATETIQFAVDGRGYEFDASASTAAEFRIAMAGYVESARPLGKVVIGKLTTLRPVGGRGRSDLAAVRQWATTNGYNVAPRGRIRRQVLEAYENRNR